MLLLFDIDGTLTTGGPARAAFFLAVERTFGRVDSARGHDFAGKTDELSLRQILTAAGRSTADLEAGRAEFRARYLSELEARIGDDPVTTLPGARELVETLADRGDACLALVTGNIADGARIKLQSAGFWDRFPVGAFGCDHEVRNELPRFALDRAARHWRRSFRGEDAVVIGDTPLDVECGKTVGAATVAVATGQFPASRLRDAGADHVLRNLADTGAVLEILDGMEKAGVRG